MGPGEMCDLRHAPTISHPLFFVSSPRGPEPLVMLPFRLQDDKHPSLSMTTIHMQSTTTFLINTHQSIVHGTIKFIYLINIPFLSITDCTHSNMLDRDFFLEHIFRLYGGYGGAAVAHQISYYANVEVVN